MTCRHPSLTKISYAEYAQARLLDGRASRRETYSKCTQCGELFCGLKSGRPIFKAPPVDVVIPSVAKTNADFAKYTQPPAVQPKPFSEMTSTGKIEYLYGEHNDFDPVGIILLILFVGIGAVCAGALLGGGAALVVIGCGFLAWFGGSHMPKNSAPRPIAAWSGTNIDPPRKMTEAKAERTAHIRQCAQRADE